MEEDHLSRHRAWFILGYFKSSLNKRNPKRYRAACPQFSMSHLILKLCTKLLRVWTILCCKNAGRVIFQRDEQRVDNINRLRVPKRTSGLKMSSAQVGELIQESIKEIAIIAFHC